MPRAVERSAKGSVNDVPRPGGPETSFNNYSKTLEEGEEENTKCLFVTLEIKTSVLIQAS
jgi:hypothetical protein